MTEFPIIDSAALCAGPRQARDPADAGIAHAALNVGFMVVVGQRLELVVQDQHRHILRELFSAPETCQ